MSTLEQELANPGRKLICRYLRKDGMRCTNETVAAPDDDVLLCGKHMLEAYRQFQAHAKKAGASAGGRRAGLDGADVYTAQAERTRQAVEDDDVAGAGGAS